MITWIVLSVLAAILLTALYILLRGPVGGPTGMARCRECGEHFDHSRSDTEQMAAWREWGLVLCRTCAARKKVL